MHKIIQSTLCLPYFKKNSQGTVPIPYNYFPSNSKLLLMLGDNASGKSVFRRCLTYSLQDNKLLAMNLSLEGRCSGGFARLFMYRSEMDNSTGSNSAYTLLKSIQTSKSSQEKHVIILDEPELGLSENWIVSMGACLNEFLNDVPENLVGVAIISHSKILVDALLKHNPSVICFGYKDLNEWLNTKPAIRPLKELQEENYKRYNMIHQVKPKKK